MVGVYSTDYDVLDGKVGCKIATRMLCQSDQNMELCDCHVLDGHRWGAR